MSEPRLVKYAGPSGRCDPVRDGRAGREPEGGVGRVALRREVHLPDERLDAIAQRPSDGVLVLTGLTCRRTLARTDMASAALATAQRVLGGGGRTMINVETVVALAVAQQGDQYVSNAQNDPANPDPSEWDCSELVRWACARAGVHAADARRLVDPAALVRRATASSQRRPGHRDPRRAALQPPRRRRQPGQSGRRPARPTPTSPCRSATAPRSRRWARSTA